MVSVRSTKDIAFVDLIVCWPDQGLDALKNDIRQKKQTNVGRGSNNHPGPVRPVNGALPSGQNASAIVVTYWTGPFLFECLKAVVSQPEIQEVIVINNGNPAAVVKELRTYAAAEQKVNLIEPERNTGFAAGCNLGAASATGKFLAFVNPDCILPEGTMSRILEVFDSQENTWLCGGRLQNPDGTEQRGGRREILSPWRSFVELLRFDKLFPNHPYFRRLHLHEGAPQESVQEVPTVSGAFMVIPNRYYDRLGGMDDNMFLHFDDADLCIRVAQKGGKVLYCGHVPVTHHLSTSDVSRTFIQWHKTRSTSYYFYKHFHVSYPYWFLMIVSGLLWMRFIVLMPKLLVGDIPGIIRRWRSR